MNKNSNRLGSVKDAKWREFEKMVARIEACFGPQGITITSPDFVDDVITSDKREVDATLRYQIGSAKVLVAVECRDRKGVEDVLWIEQLVTKQRDLRADKCVAVSSSRFSKAAIQKAKHYDIGIRLVQDITEKDVLEWFDNIYIDVEYHTFSITDATFILETGGGISDVQLADDLAAAFKANSWDALILFDRDENKWVNAQFLIEDCLKQSDILFDSSVPLGNQYRRPLSVKPTPPAYTRTNKGQFDVSCLLLKIDITRRQERLTLKDHLQYRDEEKPRAYVAQAKLAIDGHGGYTFLVQRNTDDPSVVKIDVQAHGPQIIGGGKYGVAVKPPED